MGSILATKGKNVSKQQTQKLIPRWRYFLVMSGLFALPILLITHIAQLQIMPDEEFGVDFVRNLNIFTACATFPKAL